jgi:hypothetical protein
MGNNKASKRMTARRAATFLAAVGALVMSSGVALMVAATPANAAPDQSKVVVCKYVGTPGGTIDHIVVVADNTIPGFGGSFPFEWTEAHGQSLVGSVAIRFADAGPPPEQASTIELSECPSGEEEPPQVCPEDATAHAGEEIPEGQTAEEFCTADVIPPEVCPEDSTANAGQEIPEGQTAAEFCTAEVIVSPPDDTDTVVNPPKKHETKSTTVTPTVVHAGLAGASVEDVRGEQGLALVFGGMLMLLAAGGLGLRLRGSASRI